MLPLSRSVFALATCALATLALPETAGAQQRLGAPLQVSTVDHDDHQAFPDIAVGPNDEFMVVWQSLNSAGNDSDGFSIQARRFDATGAPLGDQFQVNTTTAGAQHQPEVVILDSGEAVVVWQSGQDIVGQRYDEFGAPQGTEFAIATTSDQEIGPSIAAMPGGLHWVVWEFHAMNGFSPDLIRAQRYDAAGAPLGATFDVASMSPGGFIGLSSADVSLSDQGEAVVTWGSQFFDIFEVKAQRFDASANPVGSNLVVTSQTTAAQVAHTSNGDFLVLYPIAHFSELEPTEVRVRGYDGSGVPTAFHEVATFSDDLLWADIAVGPSGEFAVAWSRGAFDVPSATYQERIQVQRYHADGAEYGTTLNVEIPTPRTGGGSRGVGVALDAAGIMTIVWNRDIDPTLGGIDWEIYLRRSGIMLVPSLGALGLSAVFLLLLASGARGLRRGDWGC